jgi:hypothetical protein
MKRLAILPVLILTLSGCDVIYGVSRNTPNTLEMVPDISCVTSAVSSVSGVSEVSHRIESGGRPLTLHGIEKPDQIHRFFYKYNGLSGNFYFLINYQAHAEFHHTYIEMNRKPPQSEIDQMRPVMRQIEQAIENRCGMTDLNRVIKETCYGVLCKGA